MPHEEGHNLGLNEQRETANLDAEGNSTLIKDELEASIHLWIRQNHNQRERLYPLIRRVVRYLIL